MSKRLSSAQKLFNRVVRHLLRQNCKALSPQGNCVYRAKNGKRCAVGGVLPNRLYKPGMEEKNVTALFDNFPEVADYFGRENQFLLSDCQHVHDTNCYTPSAWPSELAKIAQEHGLTMPKV